MMPAPAQKPTEAYVLSLLGGVFVILGGAVVMTLGYWFGFYFIWADFFILGALGIGDGVVICIAAVMLNDNPAKKELWGILIIVPSILSWFVALGGFFIGFILALIGGILALTWAPTQATLTWVPAPPPPPPPPFRVCLACGRQIDPTAKFCHVCGKPVPD